MLNDISQENTFPAQVYELAANHRVGTPLKRQQRRFLQILLLLELLISIALVGWVAYNLYGYIGFTILTHTYPDSNSVPDGQLDHYLWLKVIHDQFWQNILQAAVALLTLLGQLFTFIPAYRTKLYLCTEGLLKIYSGKEEAVRWDEVKEIYVTNNNITRLAKQKGSDLFLPPLLISGRKKVFSRIVAEEVTHCLLPGMLERYAQGETITFGSLEVNQEGISRSGEMVYWRQVGDIALEGQALSVYYQKLGTHSKDEEQTLTTFVGQWHTWKSSTLASASWPNLSIFVTLVNTILDQRGVYQIDPSPTQQALSLKEVATLVKRKKRRKTRIVAVITIVSILSVLTLAIGIPIYFSVQQQQRIEKDTQILQNHFRQLARQSYADHVPGEHCGNGKNFWLDDSDTKNIYTCQKNGLLMTLNDLSYADAEWFTLMPGALSKLDSFSSVAYFPHHYRVQVQATALSDTQDICVGMGVHEQDYMEDQSFDVCTDGNWYFYRCDSHCSPETLLASGTLSHPERSYLIMIDVTDNVLSLSVDHTQVTSVSDATYHSTDQIELEFYGPGNLNQPIQTRFSDFAYMPFS